MDKEHNFNEDAVSFLKSKYSPIGSQDLQIAIIGALGEAGGKEAVSFLKSKYSPIGSQDLQIAIVKAIGRAGRII